MLSILLSCAIIFQITLFSSFLLRFYIHLGQLIHIRSKNAPTGFISLFLEISLERKPYLVSLPPPYSNSISMSMKCLAFNDTHHHIRLFFSTLFPYLIYLFVCISIIKSKNHNAIMYSLFYIFVFIFVFVP